MPILCPAAPSRLRCPCYRSGMASSDVHACSGDNEAPPTWKDAHDALSTYVTTLVCGMSPEARDSAFARYTALRDALADAADGTACTGDPCICTNGIGCVTVPVEQW